MCTLACSCPPWGFDQLFGFINYYGLRIFFCVFYFGCVLAKNIFCSVFLVNAIFLGRLAGWQVLHHFWIYCLKSFTNFWLADLVVTTPFLNWMVEIFHFCVYFLQGEIVRWQISHVGWYCTIAGPSQRCRELSAIQFLSLIVPSSSFPHSVLNLLPAHYFLFKHTSPSWSFHIKKNLPKPQYQLPLRLCRELSKSIVLSFSAGKLHFHRNFHFYPNFHLHLLKFSFFRTGKLHFPKQECLTQVQNNITHLWIDEIVATIYSENIDNNS